MILRITKVEENHSQEEEAKGSDKSESSEDQKSIYVSDSNDSYEAPDKEIIETESSKGQVSKSEAEEETKESFKECLVSYDIVFKDTGCGISKENQKRLFQNFGKIEDTQNQNKQGVGLGLSICKAIIMRLGGKFKVESEEGQGCAFTISMTTKSQLNEKKFEIAKKRFAETGELSASSNQFSSDAESKN